MNYLKNILEKKLTEYKGLLQTNIEEGEIEIFFDDLVTNLTLIKDEELNKNVEDELDKLDMKPDEIFQEFKETILDLLFNRVEKIETFKGITSTTEDVRFRNLIRDFEDEVINMPEFQRKYIWDKTRASELITSLIYGIPIPPIYSYEIENEGIRNIIDGQQRLTSLLFYYYNAFPKSIQNRTSYNKNLFKLLKKRKEILDKNNLNSSDLNEIERKIKDMGIELNPQFRVRSYDGDIYDLAKVNEQVRGIIFNRNISVITIKSDNKAAMAYIFNVYNTGGVKLTENEIRKAIFSNNVLYKFIVYVAETDNYKDLIIENKYDYQELKEKNKILQTFMKTKDIEHSLFQILAYNFNLNYSYNKENRKYAKDMKKLEEILNQENIFSGDMINILNKGINYAKGKIHSIIDEYSNFISKDNEYSRKEISKLNKFIEIIKKNISSINSTKYSLKNLICIYILLDYFDSLDKDIFLKNDYFSFDKKVRYETLEKERFIYIANLLKRDGVIL